MIIIHRYDVVVRIAGHTKAIDSHWAHTARDCMIHVDRAMKAKGYRDFALTMFNDTCTVEIPG